MATAFPSRSLVWTRPLHGIFSAYPLALFTTALLTDIIYVYSTSMMWADFSVWLIAGGVIMGVLAAIVGLIEALSNRRHGRSRRPWPHTAGTIVMLLLAILNGFVHSRDAWTSVVPTGLILSAIVAVLAVVTSWLGYSLEARQETK